MGLFSKKSELIDLNERLSKEEIELLTGELVKAPNNMPSEAGNVYYKVAESIKKKEGVSAKQAKKLCVAALRFNLMNKKAGEGTAELITKLEEILK